MDETFTLAGGGTTFTFAPASRDGGTYRMAGVEEGVSYVGQGEYSLGRDTTHQPVSLILNGEMTLSTAEGAMGVTLPEMTIPLTPTSTCD